MQVVAPTLEKLCKQKEQRLREFSNVQTQIQEICGEIAGKLNLNDEASVVDEFVLTLKKLEEYHTQLQELQKEKSERLHKQYDRSAPSLNDSNSVQSKSISNETLSKLAETVVDMKEDKKQRLQKELGEELWLQKTLGLEKENFST